MIGKPENHARDTDHPPRKSAPGCREALQGRFREKDRRRPTLPPGCPGSTIGAEGLNGRVRDGNGCLPLAIATEKINNSILQGFESDGCFGVCRCCEIPIVRGLRRIRSGVKPHGPLVPVSSTHCCAYTSGLSTLWSTRGLQSGYSAEAEQPEGRSRLEGGFPLRCFQRLSCPNVATRRCPWQDNRYTSGSSTPVLSY